MASTEPTDDSAAAPPDLELRRAPPTTAPRSFTGWTKQPAAEPNVVAALYEQGHTEREIAVELGLSRQRISDALTAAGVARRKPGRTCPVDGDELHRLFVDEGLSQAQLARRFDAASGTVSRWLAECGLGTPDPRADPARLRELYVTQRLTTREVGEVLGMSPNRVTRELALAGIPRRSPHDRRPRDARANVTKDALEEMYVRRGLTVRELTEVFGVSDEYLRKRLREVGFAKRPGTFRPKLERDRADLMAAAVELYAREGSSMRDVANELDISASTVRDLLHEAGATVRPPGRHPIGSERRVLRDLYKDPDVVDVLRRFGVVVQDPQRWSRPSPCETVAPWPLPAKLLEELYVRLGLSAFHIGLLCGFGAGAVLNRLRVLGIDVRPGGQPCPWTERRYG